MAGVGASRPSALSHGPTSRWIFEAQEQEIAELAEALAGSSPCETAVVDAAREAAQAMLRLRQVRVMKTHAMREAEPNRQYAANAYGLFVSPRLRPP